jgi:hypothetical protein
MKNLAHSASFDSDDKDAPSKLGIKHLDTEDQMRTQFEATGFRIRDWTNYTDEVIAKLLPPTNPSAMQRDRTFSNKCRNKLLSRNLPCLFLEKVE